MTLIKICGLTRPTDVELAIDAGAWAVGFVLTESRRHVSVAEAATLAARVPAEVLTVGVFGAEPATEIARATRSAGLRAVQLSAGAEGPSVATVRAAMTAAGHEAVVIAARDADGVEDADFALFEWRLGPAYGAAERPLDGDGLAQEPGEWDPFTRPAVRRVILGGGLTPDNVSSAVLQVHPFAVDAAGGVESVPGAKDAEKVAAFAAAVRAVDGRFGFAP